MAEGFLEERANAIPEVAEDLRETQSLFQQRLWHQLTDKLFKSFNSTSYTKHAGLLQEMHSNLVMGAEGKINPLKAAQLAVTASAASESYQSSLEFLSEARSKIEGVYASEKSLNEPLLYIDANMSLVELRLGEEDKGKDGIQESVQNLSNLVEPSNEVSATVRFAAAQLAKARSEFAEFFTNGMAFLSFVDSASFSKEQQRSLAVDLGLASLLAEGVYSFGELLQHPIMEAIKGTESEWVNEVVEAFNDGNLHRYDDICTKNSGKMNSQPALVSHAKSLREKITVLALLQLVFSLPAEERTLSLESIKNRTKLPTGGAELLVMKAVSDGLLEASIDQVEGVVHVTWAKPRTLLRPQIESMRDRLSDFLSKVDSTLASFEKLRVGEQQA